MVTQVLCTKRSSAIGIGPGTATETEIAVVELVEMEFGTQRMLVASQVVQV